VTLIGEAQRFIRKTKEFAASWLFIIASAGVREMFFLKSIQMVEGSGVHWFAGVLQSLCSPS
jgi:tagatose-1,6-bisphosphate aldolase